MSELTKKVGSYWQDTINVLLGLWLIASPWALGFATETTLAWNVWVTGMIIAVVAIAALIAFQTWEEWINVALGAWLTVSPWVLGFTGNDAAMWNAIAVGVVVAGLALWSSTIEHDGDGLLSHS